MTDRVSGLSFCSPRVIALVALAGLLLFSGQVSLSAQGTNPLARRWADVRVQGEENRFLLQSQQITAEEAQRRTGLMNTELAAIRAAMNALPRPVQTEITQQAETLFQVRIVPLREQWNQALAEKRLADQARFAELTKELQADAAVSGKVQAERTLLRERAQRGEVSQADATRTDQQAEQQILALHRKYDALDMERAAIGQRPYWASQFSRAEAAFAARAVAEGRVRLRLDDTQTEIGKDAHRAANLTLSMQRNQLFQAQLAITPQEAQSLNATAQALLTSLQQKYATSPAAADYRDRVVRLVQEGAAAQRPQWERDAAAAKVEAAARRAAAAAPPAQQVGVPVGNPQPVPLETSQPAPTSDGRRTARGPTTSGARPVPRAPQTPPVVLATQIPRQTPGGGIPWTPVIVLLLLGAGGAGAYALRARMATAPPTFAPAPHITDPVQTSGTGAGHASAQRASSTEVPPAPGIGGLKEHLLAQQREKYQTRYNDALDEVTNASMALTQMAPLLSSAHANLHTLSTSLYGRVHAVIVARYGSLWKALMNAALLRPVWRLFRRVPVLPKIGIGVGLYFLWSRIFQAFSAGDFATVVLIYGGIVAAGFFIERHLVLKAPLALLKRNAGEFKALRLAHLYVDQRPEVIQGQSALRGLRILAADTLPLAHDEAFEASVGAGTFLLGVGTLGSYRVDPSGSTTVLTSAQGNEFMNQHGGLLLEVVSQLGDFAPNTFPPLAQYGQVHWRKQRAANALPQLEALVRDVDRIEKVWQDVYVSDEVFEFLFRSIDMFNMRDAATPPGLLLYGLPGNGKKYLARKIADTLSARFEQVTPSKIASADQIKDLWTASRGTDPVVLFVPNAETVFPKTQDGTSARDTLEWIAEWEKHEPRESRVWVVMTGRSDEAMDPAVLDHVGRDSKIEVQGPDTAGREVLLQMACRQYQVSAPPSDTVAKTMGGVSIQDLRRIVMAAKRAAAPGQPQDSHWKQAIQTVRGADAKFKDETKTWDRLILPPKIKEQLQLACKVLQDAQESKKKGLEVPRVLLFGPPGTGKTEIARTIANEAGVNFMEGSLAKMKGKYIGSSGQMVTELFAKARASAPTVLFLDEIDAVSKERGSEGTDSFTDDITNVLLTELEGVSKPDRPVFILAATNHHEVMDEAILRRFKRKIEIPKPDEWGRREILKVLFSDRRDAIDFDVEDVATVVAKRTDGQAGSFLRDLVQKAMEEAELVAQATSPPGTVRLTRDLVMAETERLRREGSDGVDPTATWDTLVLSDQTMNELKRLSRALRNMEERLRQGVEPPRGAVLFGPPGTGKTQIAKTLANESGVRFLLKGPADLGRTAESVRELFNAARKKAPCILFIDEFENAAKSRDLGGSAEVVTELLSQIQGAKKETRPIFVLAATNYLERVDKAVLDRFSAYQIEVPYPTPEQRERLFTVFLKKVPRIDFDIDTTAAELAQLAGSVGGRRIYDSVDKALQEAANRAEEAGTGEPIVLRREDLLRQFAPKGRPVSEEDLTTVWSQIVLKPEVKDSLLSMIRLFNSGDKAAPKGLLLWGPSGTGKTEIARLLAQSTGCEFLATDLSKLKGMHVGESGQNVRALWEKARVHGKAVIFVDECDGVFARRGGTNTDAAVEEINNAFLPMWDGLDSKGQIWVVGATNKRDRIDEAMNSRFGEMIEIGLPEAAERIDILRLEMRKLESEIEVPEFVGKATSGFAGRNLSKVAAAVYRKAATQGGKATDDLWRQVIKEFATATADAVDATARWDTLILQDPIIKRLRRISEMLKYAESLREQGLEPPKAALLFGPPGTGKTQIARTLANESGLNFIAASPSDIKGAHLGVSGRLVKELFERARAKPTVLFIDEIESTAASRNGGKGDQYTGEIVNELLTQMDGVKKVSGTVFVLAATNHPHLVDEAVLSRFDERLEIPNPGPDERRRMLKIFVGKLRVDFDVDEMARELSAKLDGLSGRDLMALVRRASQQSVERAIDAGTPGQIVLSREDLISQLTTLSTEEP